ncbi:hypothetical protein PFLA_a2796 [Pseudoalteromonas flavipulchra NCIMB 2033 = ATCC BAA-314]|nr:hypothetical protein [Pseudoalteromonas flavipulchra NCIMB 2033 = ATCC BAA-314]
MCVFNTLARCDLFLASQLMAWIIHCSLVAGDLHVEMTMFDW